MQAIGQFCRDLGEGRGVGYRLVADTVELLDEFRDRPLWVDQGAPGRDPVTLCFQHADPCDAVPYRIGPGGLQADEGKPRGNHEAKPGARQLEPSSGLPAT
jgi:hypothetical protein